ncbi:RNA polymerase subunit sigma24 [Rufibacter radiotolerans]|uniref:RNA polymerase subunit sigma24 n=1 Tax=Rufibacter radiotolerans TaxID=1379910 RepID=A0A0H4WAI9_9BACT|nr:RNA polymerase sigma factor [Rufibacter radiotolerans]AKQ47506.1 RNA polymerase subunit sigma24 [Rufibacter radiotolerans]
MERVESVAVSGKTQLPDPEVVARVLSGEKDLYALLMRRHNQKLYRAVRSYLKEEQDAEDAMQDTYLLAYQKLHQFRQGSLFSTWLIRIGINVALGKLRERKRYAPASDDTSRQEDLLAIDESNYMNPENMAIRDEVKKLLEKAISSIPDKYRIVYVLREVEGLSLNEVVACLGLSESNVKVRLHRAKALLKESLYHHSIRKEVFKFGTHRCDALVARIMATLP